MWKEISKELRARAGCPADGLAPDNEAVGHLAEEDAVHIIERLASDTLFEKRQLRFLAAFPSRAGITLATRHPAFRKTFLERLRVEIREMALATRYLGRLLETLSEKHQEYALTLDGFSVTEATLRLGEEKAEFEIETDSGSALTFEAEL